MNVFDATSRLKSGTEPETVEFGSVRSARDAMVQGFPLSTRLAMASDDADRFIDLERLAAIGLRRMRVVALCGALGLILGILYLVFTPPTYTAETSILL